NMLARVCLLLHTHTHTHTQTHKHTPHQQDFTPLHAYTPTHPHTHRHHHTHPQRPPTPTRMYTKMPKQLKLNASYFHTFLTKCEALETPQHISFLSLLSALVCVFSLS